MNARFQRAQLAALVGGCVFAAAWVLSQRNVPLAPPGQLALWLLACFAGEVFWTDSPSGRGTISMALTIDLAALLSLGDRGGLEVVGLSTVLAGLFPHRRAWYKIIFNAAQSTLSAAAALFMIQHFGTDSLSLLVPTGLWWPTLLVSGLAFFLVNTSLVACAISNANNLPLWRTWRENFGYSFELAATLAQVTLAGFLLAAYNQLGLFALVTLLPVVAVLSYCSAREAAFRRQANTSAQTQLPNLRRRAG